MREDVRKLMGLAGWQEGAYVEVATAQGDAEAVAAWPLLAAVNGRLRLQAEAAPADPAPLPGGPQGGR